MIVAIVAALLSYAPFAVLRLYDRIVALSRETLGLVNDYLDVRDRLGSRRSAIDRADDGGEP